MSQEAAAQVNRESKALGLTLLLAFRLAHLVKKGTMETPPVSLAELHVLTGMSRRALQRSLADLERLGEWTAGRGRGRVKRYTLQPSLLNGASQAPYEDADEHASGATQTPLVHWKGVTQAPPKPHVRRHTDTFHGGNGASQAPFAGDVSSHVFSPVRTKKTSVRTPLTPHALETFDQFWQVYPRKVAKGQARKVWSRLTPDDVLFARIIAAVEQQKRSRAWQKDSGQFIPHPATWLNGERWNDEIQSELAPPTVRERWRCPHVEHCDNSGMCRDKLTIGTGKYPLKASMEASA